MNNSLESLIKAANELNIVLDLDPIIVTENVTEDRIIFQLLATANELVETDEEEKSIDGVFISKETFSLLESLGFKFKWREYNKPIIIKEILTVQEPEIKETPFDEFITSEKEEPRKALTNPKGILFESPDGDQKTAYKATIQVMCEDPNNMNLKLKDIYPKLEALGINTKIRRATINTAFSTVKRVILGLQSNGCKIVKS